MSIALFVVLIVAIVLGTPITFSLGAAALAAILVSPLSLITMPQRMVPSLLDASALICIPLFILAGNILSAGGMGDRLVRFAFILVGRTRGGLCSASILGSMFFGGTSGSATADASAIGSVMIPAMEKQGYDRAFATAVTVIAAPLGAVLPPSIVMIVYCWVTETSIAKLFAAGYLPGLLITVSLMVTGWAISVRKGYPVAERTSLREKLRIFVDTIPGLVMPFIIIVGIVGGFFTPTEASAVAVVYGFIVSRFYYRSLALKDLPGIFRETAKLTGIVALMIAMAGVYGWLMAFDRVPYHVAELLAGMHLGARAFLVFYVAFLIFLGLFLSPTEGIIIAVPIFFPIAMAAGINPLHFGIVSVVTKALGHVTPPVGLCLFVGSAISKLPLGTIVRALVPFYVVALVDVLLIAFVPEISTFLPRLLHML